MDYIKKKIIGSKGNETIINFNKNKIKKLGKNKIIEPSNWNNNLWLRVEFGIISPFDFTDSVIRVFCCYDSLVDSNIFSLIQKYGLSREYNLDELLKISHTFGSKCSQTTNNTNFDSFDFNHLYNFVYTNLYTLILDAYGQNGWFCKFNNISNILKEEHILLSNQSISFDTHDTSAISVTVCFKNTFN
jgi:hypothetical protein